MKISQRKLEDIVRWCRVDGKSRIGGWSRRRKRSKRKERERERKREGRKKRKGVEMQMGSPVFPALFENCVAEPEFYIKQFNVRRVTRANFVR